MTFNISVDSARAVQRSLSDLEKRQLPFAMVQAVNAAAFEVRERWADVMPQVFDRPTSLTQKAVLYSKATRAKPEARIFLRDEAFKGTPPAKYLQAQVFGGERRPKAFERRLQAKGYLPAGWFAVPGKGAELDAYGNIAGARMNRILSQLGARFDPLQNETETSRGRRERRENKKGTRRGSYFVLPADRGRLVAGVYQRVKTGFGGTLASVLRFVRKAPAYRPRYPVQELAQKVVDRTLPGLVERELQKAVASAIERGKR